MEKRIEPYRIGLVFAVFVFAWHVLWSVFVAFGWASQILDFIYGIHFLSNPFSLSPFSFWRASLLVIVTSTLGYCMGYFFGVLINWITGPRSRRVPVTQSSGT